LNSGGLLTGSRMPCWTRSGRCCANQAKR